MRYYILDASGEPVPVPMLEWARWFDNMDNRRVALTFTEEYEISTVFLGLDHNWSDSGPPLLFETMVFAKGGPARDLDMARYSTWDEAVAGHAAMVRSVYRLNKEQTE